MTLFRVRGIQLSVHVSFLLLLAYVAWEGWVVDGWRGALWTTTSAILMFVCVTLHEFGHAIAASRFGVRVPRIVLLPIGGMAEMESIPRRPRDEIIIALAGPAVNYVIVALLLVFVRFPQGYDWLYVELSPVGMARFLVIANLMMGLFNLIPAFPMDGGRVLRALLAMRTSYLKATRIAVGLGKLVALAGIVYFIHTENYHGAILFGFILFAGEMELRSVKRAEIAAEHWRKIQARFEPMIRLAPAEPPSSNRS